MRLKTLNYDQDLAIRTGLNTLYAHGWSSEQRNFECAQILADKTYNKDTAGITFDQHRKSLDRHVNYDWGLPQVLSYLSEHTEPSSKPGYFELNDQYVNPADGLSLELLERAVRFHYELTGDLEGMSFITKDVLTLDNATAFLSDWTQSKPQEPVMIRAIGDRFKLYFEPGEASRLPVLDISETSQSLMAEYPSINESEAQNLVKELQASFEEPGARFDAYQSLNKEWSEYFPPEPPRVHSHPSEGPSF